MNKTHIFLSITMLFLVSCYPKKVVMESTSEVETIYQKEFVAKVPWVKLIASSIWVLVLLLPSGMVDT